VLRALIRLTPALRLTRVTTAFAAVANVWFVLLWTRAVAEEPGRAILRQHPVWVQVIGGFFVGVGVYAFAAATNDIIDIRRDRALKRDRPIARGRISPESAVVAVSVALVAAGAGASVIGLWSVRLVMAVCVGTLFYNFAARHFPSARVVLLGLLYGAHMLVANPRLAFVWPVWVVMTHALVVSALTHRLSGARPRLTRASLAWALAGWAFWSAALLGVGVWRTGSLWPQWASWIGAVIVAALAAVFAVVAAVVARSSPAAQAADRVVRVGAFWLALYGGAWLLGQGEIAEGVGILAVAAAGFLGAVVLHEIALRLESPLDYRLDEPADAATPTPGRRRSS